MQYLIGKIGINWQVLGSYCSDPAVELGGTVDSEIFDIFDKVPNSYTFDESGNFVQLISIEEAKSIILSKKYIPDINASLIEFAQLYLRTNHLQTSKEKIVVSGLYNTWKSGKYEVGDIRNYAGQTWECWTAHDNSIYPDIKPSNPQTWANFWRPLHGDSVESARPWVKPLAGTTDMYHADEYMVYTDEKVYKCLADTTYSPEEYPAHWEVQE